MPSFGELRVTHLWAIGLLDIMGPKCGVFVTVMESGVVRHVWKAIGTLAVAMFTSIAAAADFRGVGYLDPQDNVSYANSLSRDGSVVGGLSFREYTAECPTQGTEYHWTYRRGYVWSAQAGMRGLESNPNVSQLGYDEVYDVAANGAAVFGSSYGTIQYFCGTPVGSYDARGNFLWTPRDGFVQRQGLWGQAFGQDQTVYTGAQSVLSFWGATVAIRHTEAGGTEPLGWLQWGSGTIDDFHGPWSAGTGISADGRVVVGNSTSAASYDDVSTFPGVSFQFRYSSEAFRWTEQTGMVGLGDLPGGDYGSIATDVSGDGRVVVGSSAVENSTAAFRWTPETGMVRIGGLLPGRSSDLAALSFDGSIAVGSSAIDTVIGRAAIIWDEQNGIRNIKNVLETDFGLDLTGWELIEAVDISDDGLVIAGNGINPLGQEEGWVVHLDAIPEPATVVLFVLGVGGIAVWRRRIARSVSRRCACH